MVEPYEEPRVTLVGNVRDLLAQVCVHPEADTGPVPQGQNSCEGSDCAEYDLGVGPVRRVKGKREG